MRFKNNKNITKKPSAFTFVELAIALIIVAVLLGAVAGSNKLISVTKISNAKSLTKSSPVNEIEDLVLWFESTLAESFGGTLPANGGNVTSWIDINPKRLDDNDVSGGVSPTYNKDGINGIPTVYFDGTQYLINSNPTLPVENSDRTFFAVVGNGENDSLVDMAFSYGWEDSKSFGLGLFYHAADPTTGIMMYMGGDHMCTISTQDGTEPKIISVTYIDPAATTPFSTDLQIYINGSVIAPDGGTFCSSTAVTIATTSEKLSIGGFFEGSYKVKADIGEIIVFNRKLSDEERESVESYLSQKWHINLENELQNF